MPGKPISGGRPKWLGKNLNEDFRPNRTLQDNGKCLRRLAVYIFG
jgi:hypothetical protein